MCSEPEAVLQGQPTRADVAIKIRRTYLCRGKLQSYPGVNKYKSSMKQRFAMEWSTGPEDSKVSQHTVRQLSSPVVQ